MIEDPKLDGIDAPSSNAATDGESARLERQRRGLIAIAVLLTLLLFGIIAVFGYLNRPIRSVDQGKVDSDWTFKATMTSWGSLSKDRFVMPGAVAYGPSGEIVVADANGGPRILVFDRGSMRPRLIFGKYGSKAGELGGTWGLAVDSKGNIYVSDAKVARIAVFDRNGKFLRQWPSDRPLGLAIKGDRLYVGETGHVAVFTLSGRLINRIGKFGRQQGQFDAISGIEVDDSGNIYVADGALNRVQALDKNGKLLWVSGTPPKNMNDTKRTFDYAADIRLGVDGKLYVLEGLGNQVTIVDPKTGKILKHIGEAGGEDGQLNMARGMSVSPDRTTLAIADTFNDRVQLMRIGQPSFLERLSAPRQALALGWIDPVSMCGVPLLLILLAAVVVLVVRRITARRSA